MWGRLRTDEQTDERLMTDKSEESCAMIRWAQMVLHSDATARTHPTMVSKVVQRGHEHEVK